MNSVIVQAIRNHIDCNRCQRLMLDALADALEQAVPEQERNNPGADPRGLLIKANPVGSSSNKRRRNHDNHNAQ
ncbi:hypothetical protein [Pseudomonas citrulli]|uniref:Uncharacterized protein n=1 Tax=Pseudomonas citrulli TaxID=3064347 RepID=A0ABT9C1L9_9PSED|nr:hypothetical protein [Pseudomonas sp. K18]MDO7897087.1 hypothetical protein [Pseudomonas sp. K18]